MPLEDGLKPTIAWIRDAIGADPEGSRVKLSILMPVYNEAETVEVVRQARARRAVPVRRSSWSSSTTAARTAPRPCWPRLDDPRVSVHTHPANRGKGAAIRTAAAEATGTHVVMCDADLEYSPEDLPALLRPVLDGEAEVVYGTRSFSSHTAFSFWFVLGNKGVTFFANALFDSWISDLETCFKLMPLQLYRSLDVRSAGFGMEAEITGKLLKQRRPAVRGADQLPGPQPGGGQEADLAGRRRGGLDPEPHPVRPVRLTAGAGPGWRSARAVGCRLARGARLTARLWGRLAARPWGPADGPLMGPAGGSPVGPADGPLVGPAGGWPVGPGWRSPGGAWLAARPWAG